MSEQSKCPTPDLLEKLLDGLFDSEKEAALTSHLDHCPDCRDTVDRFGKMNAITPSDGVKTGTINDAGESKFVRRRLEEIRSNPPSATSALNSGFTDVLPWLEPSDNAIGKIAEFDLVRFIGRGGMGLVFEAFDRKLQRKVAIKLMSPGLLADSHASERFLREARAAAQINHVNVVTIHGVDQIRGLPWLVMELIDGWSLDEQMKKSGQFQASEILKIARHTALGLQAAHRCGITHRDIKPSNLMLDRNAKRIKIADFGLASSLNDTSFTRSGMLVGTPDFASPEQVNSQPADARSDLFSLGSVLYLLCTNSLPFSQDSLLGTLDAVRNQNLENANTLNEDIPPALGQIVQRLMEKNPEDRFQSTTELLSAIGDVSRKKVGRYARSEEQSSLEDRWLWPALVGLAVFGLIAALVAAWLNWPEDSTKEVANSLAMENVSPEKIDVVEPDGSINIKPTAKVEANLDVPAEREEPMPEAPLTKSETEEAVEKKEEATVLDPIEPAPPSPKTEMKSEAEVVPAPLPKLAKMIESSDQLAEVLRSNETSSIKLVPGEMYRIEAQIFIENRSLLIEGDPDDRPRMEFMVRRGLPGISLEDASLILSGVVVRREVDPDSESPLIRCESSELNIEDSIVDNANEGAAIELHNSELTVRNSFLNSAEIAVGAEPIDEQKVSVSNSVLMSPINFQIGCSCKFEFNADNSQFLSQQTFSLSADDLKQVQIQLIAHQCTFASSEALFAIEADSPEARNSVLRGFVSQFQWLGSDCVVPLALLQCEHEERSHLLKWRKARVNLDSESRVINIGKEEIVELAEEVEDLSTDEIADIRKLLEREIH